MTTKDTHFNRQPITYDLDHAAAVRHGRSVYIGEACETCGGDRRYTVNHACVRCSEKPVPELPRPALEVERAFGDRRRQAERRLDDLRLQRLIEGRS